MEENRMRTKNEETGEWPGQHFKEENESQAKEEEPRFSLEILDAFWLKSAKPYCCHARLNVKQ